MIKSQTDADSDLAIDEWSRQIEAVFSDEALPRPRALDSDDALNSLRRKAIFEGAEIAFGRAVLDALRHTRSAPEKQERIFVLINMTAACRPAGGDRLLFQRLAAKTWSELQFAQQSLASLALTVVAKYEVTDALADFAEAHVLSSSNLNSQIAALDVLSRRADPRALRLMERVLPVVGALDDLEPFAVIANTVATRMGLRALYFWYCDVDRRLRDDCASIWERATEILHRIGSNAQSDPYAQLMCAEIESHRGLLELERVMELATGHSLVGEDVVRDALKRIWFNSQPFGVPWMPERDSQNQLRGPLAKFRAVVKARGFGAHLVNRSGKVPLDPDSVEAFLLLRATGDDSSLYTRDLGELD